jgi:hypothetical protein
MWERSDVLVVFANSFRQTDPFAPDPFAPLRSPSLPVRLTPSLPDRR